jgi:hypothetical protein
MMRLSPKVMAEAVGRESLSSSRGLQPPTTSHPLLPVVGRGSVQHFLDRRRWVVAHGDFERLTPEAIDHVCVSR